jgi:hypothetical protein
MKVNFWFKKFIQSYESICNKERFNFKNYYKSWKIYFSPFYCIEIILLPNSKLFKNILKTEKKEKLIKNNL